MAFANNHESRASGTMIDELVTTALLGTRTGVPRLPTLPDELTAVLPGESNGDEYDTESRLLEAAAAATVYLRAGRKPRRDVAIPAACRADHWSECSRVAADLLASMLDEGWQSLVIEWLTLAAATERRPPHRMLPSLLEAAAARRGLRTPVNAVMGERGRWLVQFNPRWQFSNARGESPVDVWHTGSREHRAEALRTIRSEDPIQAREFIAATWKEDSAELRAEWVTCLVDGLSNDDEAFLETCLDDRSVRVRGGSRVVGAIAGIAVRAAYDRSGGVLRSVRAGCRGKHAEVVARQTGELAGHAADKFRQSDAARWHDGEARRVIRSQAMAARASPRVRALGTLDQDIRRQRGGFGRCGGRRICGGVSARMAHRAGSHSGTRLARAAFGNGRRRRAIAALSARCRPRGKAQRRAVDLLSRAAATGGRSRRHPRVVATARRNRVASRARTVRSAVDTVFRCTCIFIREHWSS